MWVTRRPSTRDLSPVTTKLRGVWVRRVTSTQLECGVYSRLSPGFRSRVPRLQGETSTSLHRPKVTSVAPVPGGTRCRSCRTVTSIWGSGNPLWVGIPDPPRDSLGEESIDAPHTPRSPVSRHTGVPAWWWDERLTKDGVRPTVEAESVAGVGTGCGRPRLLGPGSTGSVPEVPVGRGDAPTHAPTGG